jgi:hypothetical protein
MALELSLSRGTISAGASTMTITDATGDYNASTNPTGYGSPNTARNVLALYLYAINKRYDGGSDLVNTELTIATYDPTIVSEWTVTLNKDGWQQVTVYGLNLYNVNTLLEVGEIVYNGGVLERITSRTGGSAPYTYTKVAATEDDLGNPPYTTAYKTTIDTYALPDISEIANKAIKQYFDYKTDPSKTTTEIKQAKEVAEELDLGITALTYGFEHGYMSESQKQLESLENTGQCFTDSLS